MNLLLTDLEDKLHNNLWIEDKNIFFFHVNNVNMACMFVRTFYIDKVGGLGSRFACGLGTLNIRIGIDDNHKIRCRLQFFFLLLLLLLYYTYIDTIT